MSLKDVALLPSKNYNFYAGIDPGFRGAVGVINAAGTTVKVWDMPMTTADKDRQKEIDLDGLREVFQELRLRPDLVLGVEWPSTRPGEGAERSERFGRGKGYLHAYAHLLGLDYYLLVPNLWKGRLGLPGKTDPEANAKAARLFDTYYPDHTNLIRGPRGGIRDGRADALLIAHFLRARSTAGMRGVVERFGKDSDEAWALAFGSGRRRRGGNPGLQI